MIHIPSNKKTYIYIHVCCINNWKQVFNTLILDIQKCGLYNKIHEIRCNVLTENRDNLSFFNDDKIKIIGTSSNLNSYETSTLKLLYEHALLEDFNVLYLHTKGIRHNNTNINVTDWVKYLSYFNIYKHDVCINQLSNFDAVGVNLQNEPHFHYSGNFWWSKSKYIKKLSLPIHTEYNSPEFWLTKTKIGNYLSLWNSNINHYYDRYTEDNYANKNIDIEKAYKVISYTPIKIIDCFIFYNEFDLLTYRLNALNDVVDYFVLVESTHTHVGKEKQLFYNENKHLFEKFNNKIIHVIVNDFPHKYPNINIAADEQWINEKFQRNCISRGISRLNLHPTDIITIADLDEIPNPIILENIKTNVLSISVNILEMDFYYYNLNTRMNDKWHHAKILSFQKYIELNLSCDNIRFYDCQIIHGAGWHLSYFGNEKFIKNKLENFTHQEYNKSEFTNEKQIEARIKNKSDLFGRTGINMTNIPIRENTNLPCLYDKYLTQFITE
jgi:beta-1,4-mannosyl-glycoprotein beta-1,4-N-acetylglucosaminyltransferase